MRPPLAILFKIVSHMLGEKNVPGVAAIHHSDSRVALWSARKVLRLPLVYNTSGYDSPEALALLDGIVEIYMPDMKYGDDNLA
jgi:uncharacterized Fe-S radical SAM superfamily protein PflX